MWFQMETVTKYVQCRPKNPPNLKDFTVSFCEQWAKQNYMDMTKEKQMQNCFDTFLVLDVCLIQCDTWQCKNSSSPNIDWFNSSFNGLTPSSSGLWTFLLPQVVAVHLRKLSLQKFCFGLVWFFLSLFIYFLFPDTYILFEIW